jgi:hypothetical protein
MPYGLSVPPISFGAEMLQSMSQPCAALKRRVSSPKLVAMSSMLASDNPTQLHETGNVVRLQTSQCTVTARTMKVFAPFAMAPAMVVRIHSPHIDLNGDFTLKVYDRRCSTSSQETYDAPVWNGDRDLGFEKHQWHDPTLKQVLNGISNHTDQANHPST